LVRIERAILGFIWANGSSKDGKGIDRIKRVVLKNSIENGGLNITDIDCLNRSLKLKQYLRAGKTGHPIKFIQIETIEAVGTTYKENQDKFGANPK
jgi:hypothetical protein